MALVIISAARAIRAELLARTKRDMGGLSMTKAGTISVLCALELAFATSAFADAARKKVAAPPDVRQAAPLPPVGDSCRSGFVCRQDLFDRNNPNNIRSDYRAPPAQPGQY
jgi:hypothetical protein